MASSFVEYRGYGFWASDGLLQIWLYFLTKKINLSENNAVWLNEAGEEWAIQAQGVCTGCIYVGLDEYITTPERNQTLIAVSYEAIDTLRVYGFVLKKEKLNGLELGTNVWTVDVPVKELVQLAEKFITLLQGTLQSIVVMESTRDPDQAIQYFLQNHYANLVSDDTLVKHIAMQAERPLLQWLKEIKQLLSHLPSDDHLLELVMQDATIQFKKPSNENVREWLRWLEQQIQNVLLKNNTPFQPMRAKLDRIVEPDDERFPHDLLLYPTDEPLPELWFDQWSQANRFYKAFKKEWDRKTCPRCNTATIRGYFNKKLARILFGTASEYPLMPAGSYPSTAVYYTYTVFKCDACNYGWTEYLGTKQHTETASPWT